MRPFLISFCLLLCACLPEPKSEFDIGNIEIVEGSLGGRSLYVPEPYFMPGSTDFSDGTITLQAQYPSLLPLEDSPTEMWAQGRQLEYLRILIYTIRTEKDFDALTRERVSFFKAYEVVGEEYGLTHQKQPPEHVQDKWDIWLEKNGDEYESYITCTEMLSDDSVPQCSHNIRTHAFFITIDYDKRLLPQWEMIKQDVIQLSESFSAPKSARDFLRQRIETSKSISQETEP